MWQLQDATMSEEEANCILSNLISEAGIGVVLIKPTNEKKVPRVFFANK